MVSIYFLLLFVPQILLTDGYLTLLRTRKPPVLHSGMLSLLVLRVNGLLVQVDFHVMEFMEKFVQNRAVLVSFRSYCSFDRDCKPVL